MSEIANTSPSVVVIPAHNAGGTLGRQLRALAEQRDAPSFGVIVVLNRCTDHTRTVAQAFTDDLDIKLVVANSRPGVSYARNAGVNASSAAIVLHADADDEVSPGWVTGMLTALSSADLVGGILRPPEDAERAWFLDRRLYGFDDLPTSRGVAYPVGASMGYHRKVFEAVGGFDERIIGGSEEIAFALAAERAGFRVAVAREAVTTYVPRYDRRSTLRQRHNYGRSESWLRARHAPQQLRSPLRELFGGTGLVATNLVRSATTDRTRRRRHLLAAAYAWGRTVGYGEVARSGEWPTHLERRASEEG